MRTVVYFNQTIKNNSGEDVEFFVIPDLPCRVITGDRFEWEGFVPDKGLDLDLSPGAYDYDETYVSFVVIEMEAGEVTQSIFLSQCPSK